jgi:hypothetical protein
MARALLSMQAGILESMPWPATEPQGEWLPVREKQGEITMAENDWAGMHNRQRGDSMAVPDEVEDGTANGLSAGAGRADAEALKRAACEGVNERCERIDEPSGYGCVDWYLYRDGERELYAG